MKIVGFDLEIAKVVPQGEKDWDKHRPLGISCAAVTRIAGELSPKYSLPTGGPNINGTITHVWPSEYYPSREMYNHKLNQHRVDELIEFLYWYHSYDYYIITWNGLKFDFAILAEECSPDYMQKCKTMALNHIDIGFQMLCERGYMIGLDTAAKGLGLEGKTEGMHGAIAPVLWQKDRKSQDKVLEYVGQDAKTTADVYKEIMAQGHVPWTAKSGRLNYWRPGIVVIEEDNSVVFDPVPGMYLAPAMKTRLLTVKEALKLRLPDTSWMDDPISRKGCYEWTGYKP